MRPLYPERRGSVRRGQVADERGVVALLVGSPSAREKALVEQAEPAYAPLVDDRQAKPPAPPDALLPRHPG
jgi:hypothetical protein